MSHTEPLVKFFDRYPALTYRRGTLLIRGGEKPRGIMFLVQGYVRQYHLSDSGEQLLLHTYKPGAFFPMTWGMADIPNRYFFDAITDVAVKQVNKEELNTFLQKNPAELAVFSKRILRGLDGLLRRIEHLVLDSAYRKTVSFILYYAQTFAKTAGVEKTVTVPLTHRELGAWIGTSRETVSLTMEKLKTKGLIRYQGRRLVIPDVHLLTQELDRKTIFSP